MTLLVWWEAFGAKPKCNKRLNTFSPQSCTKMLPYWTRERGGSICPSLQVSVTIEIKAGFGLSKTLRAAEKVEAEKWMRHLSCYHKVTDGSLEIQDRSWVWWDHCLHLLLQRGCCSSQQLLSIELPEYNQFKEAKLMFSYVHHPDVSRIQFLVFNTIMDWRGTRYLGE